MLMNKHPGCTASCYNKLFETSNNVVLILDNKKYKSQLIYKQR